jgi:AcrR family transcriptional regulator
LDERSFSVYVMEDPMPRITAQREAEKRARILAAARVVFVTKGFHEASIDDLVAASGVSVGAIYNYFGGKDELIHDSILASVNAEADAALADTLSAGSARERMDRAIAGWFDYTIDPPGAAAFLAQCWAVATQRPLIRDLLVRRRERMVMVATLIGRGAVETGELPADFDVDAMGRGFTALLDGLVLQRVEEGDGYRRAEMERRVLAFLDLIAPRPPDPGAA